MREDRIIRNEALYRRYAIVEKLDGEREPALSDPRR